MIPFYKSKRIAIIYKDEESAKSWFIHFFTHYFNTVEKVERTRDETRIFLKDYTVIKIFKFYDGMLGERFDEIYIDNYITEEEIMYVIRPCLTGNQIHYVYKEAEENELSC